MPTIFSQIIEGKIPSYKIFEDDLTYAFLDIFPVRPGHVLLIPKIEVDYFVDVPDEYYQAVFKNAKILAGAIDKATKCQRTGMLVEGVEVAHFHLHLIPIHKDQSFFGPKKRAQDGDLYVMQQRILQHLNHFDS